MSVKGIHNCFLCNNETQPQKRVYLRNLTEEPLVSLKNLLVQHHSEEEVQKCLKEQIVLCKGACVTSIRKLSKLKQELIVLENDIVNKLCVRFETERDDEDPPPIIMRTDLSTLERDTLSLTIAEGTPCVSVSK